MRWICRGTVIHAVLLGSLTSLAPCCVVAATVAKSAPEALEFFETKVRPILVDSCLRCHGPKKQGSGLRLDSRAAILEGGENGAAISPGEAEKSLLIQAVRHSHPEIKMPPKGKLPEPAIAALAEWVQRGAPWPEGSVLAPAERDKAAEAHWAFQPLQNVEPPAVKDRSWPTARVDAFILAMLEQNGMVPSARADKRTLIRRATFDLTGLPPTVEEVDAFEADALPDAFARVVDRLLASPRYGERWGRLWLDVARYADTKGYVFTEDRRYPFAYTYRDYVIRAFNEDLPFDRFIVEQIAADRLAAGSDSRSLAALGFLTVGRRFLNDGNDIIDDRIDVVTRGFLGLTVTCARCHDHKYDPIPTDDYYSLHGVFASSVEPAELPAIVSPGGREETRDFEREHQTLESAYREARTHVAEKIQKEVRDRLAPYLVAAFDVEFNPRHPKVADRAKADNLSQSRLRWVCRQWKSYLEKTRDRKDPVFSAWHALACLSSEEFAGKAPALIDALSASKTPLNSLVTTSLASRPPRRMSDVAARYGELLAQAEARWRERLKAGAPQSLAEPEWESLRQVIYDADGPLGIGDRALPVAIAGFSEMRARFLDPDDRKRLADLKTRYVSLESTHPGAPARAMVLNDAPQPVNPYVFVRGNPGRRGKDVPRQFLKVLAGPSRKPFAQGSGRLELARAIADPSNPLTARVIVNRVWFHHFGSGLVATPSDFGLRSTPPTHPELLDDLAGKLIQGGWSIKGLHRRIMLSSTYQQRSDGETTDHERDPENRLLSRFPRRRLDFESMRDALLAVSGALDPAMGGPSTAISAPPYPPRRTVYGVIDRQNLDGVYRTFDFASPDATSPRRYVTTGPQQALFLMNSPFAIAQAKTLVANAGDPGTPEARVRGLYRRIFGRAPSARETDLGLRFVRQQSMRGRAPTPIWQYGFGRFDEATRQVAGFEPFRHWSGTAWQVGPKLPDPVMHFLGLNAGGGHVGDDATHAAIRRWTAPRDATIAIDATLEHPNPNGDGVRARIVASRGGELGHWIAHHAKIATRVASYAVKRGETIDFVVDCRGESSFDTFAWAPTIREIGPTRAQWTASAGFQGPEPPALSPWEEYAQVLLLTNEFMFID
jgi:hypothetical protein